MLGAILIIFVLLLLNGFFSMCEIALVSSRRSRLAQKARKGKKGAVIALGLLEEPEKFLSTVQVGITLVGIIAGAYGGEQFTPYFLPLVERIEILQPAAEQITFALVVALLTYFTIIVGELVPKTLAFNNPEKITVLMAPAMRVITRIAYPLVALLSVSTKLILKLFFIRQTKSPPITEDELKYLIDTGARHGTIAREEGAMLHSVFRFGDQTARSLMTPVSEVGWLNVTQPKEALLEDVFNLPYTKYPVCDGRVDRIVGVISVTDILRHVSIPDFDIRKYVTPPVFFTEATPALRILEAFREHKVHIGFVKTASGKLTGMVTLHDLIENIIGELPDSEQSESLTLVWRSDGSLLAPGRFPAREVLAAFSIRDESVPAVTLGEFVTRHAHAPVRAGSLFNACGLRFEVMDMDGERVDKVLVSASK